MFGITFNASNRAQSLQASNAVVVTPHDTTEFTPSTLYIGVSGDVKVDMDKTGTAVVFKAVPVGPFPYLVTRVYSTDTDATDIVRTY